MKKKKELNKYIYHHGNFKDKKEVHKVNAPKPVTDNIKLYFTFQLKFEWNKRQ